MTSITAEYSRSSELSGFLSYLEILSCGLFAEQVMKTVVKKKKIMKVSFTE